MGEGQGRSSKKGEIYAKCWRRGENEPEEEGRDGCGEPWSSPVKSGNYQDERRLATRPEQEAQREDKVLASSLENEGMQ